MNNNFDYIVDLNSDREFINDLNKESFNGLKIYSFRPLTRYNKNNATYCFIKWFKDTFRIDKDIEYNFDMYIEPRIIEKISLYLNSANHNTSLMKFISNLDKSFSFRTRWFKIFLPEIVFAYNTVPNRLGTGSVYKVNLPSVLQFLVVLSFLAIFSFST